MTYNIHVYRVYIRAIPSKKNKSSKNKDTNKKIKLILQHLLINLRKINIGSNKLISEYLIIHILYSKSKRNV